MTQLSWHESTVAAVSADIHRASRRASALADKSGGERYSGM
jgi:hypothetical protein